MSRRARARSIPITMLPVCIGNICRSPLAEQLLRAGLEGTGRFEFGSAGLHTRNRIPMDRLSAERSLAHGGNPDGALSSVLTQDHVAASDVILTMTQGQRDELVGRHPRALKRAFTLAEFAMLLEAALAEEGAVPPRTVDAVRELLETIGLFRGQIHLTPADDVPDPVDQSPEVHRAVAAQIAGYVDRISVALGGLRIE